MPKGDGGDRPSKAGTAGTPETTGTPETPGTTETAVVQAKFPFAIGRTAGSYFRGRTMSMNDFVTGA